MITDLYLEGGWRAGILISLDGDMKVSATVSRGTFLDALDNIADDISEWIAAKVLAWVDSYFDDHEQMTQEQLDLVRTIIEEARP